MNHATLVIQRLKRLISEWSVTQHHIESNLERATDSLYKVMRVLRIDSLVLTFLLLGSLLGFSSFTLATTTDHTQPTHARSDRDEVHELLQTPQNWSSSAQFRQLLSEVETLDERLEIIAVFESELSNSKTGYLRYIYSAIAALDPQTALERFNTRYPSIPIEIIEVIFREWVHVNLDTAAEQARNLPVPLKTYAMQAILASSLHLSPEVRLEFGQIVDDRVTIEQAKKELLIATARIYPEKTLSRILNDHVVDSLQIDIFIEIVETWLQQDNSPTLEEVLQYIEETSLAKSVLFGVVTKMAEQDLSDTIDFVLSLPESNHVLGLGAVVRTGAKHSPSETLQIITELQLGAELRLNLQESLLAIWIEHDPHSVLAELTALPRPLWHSAREQAIMTVAINSPTQAIKLMDGYGINSYHVLESVVLNWGLINPREALNWCQDFELEDESLRQVLISHLIRPLTIEDAALALDIALQYSDDVFGESMISTVFDTVGTHDIDRSIQMLARLDREIDKLEAVQSVGTKLILKGEHQRAFELDAFLSSSSQPPYHAALIWTWSRSDPIHLFQTLDTLPHEDLRRVAIQTFLSDRQIHKKLTAEQRMYLKREADLLFDE